MATKARKSKPKTKKKATQIGLSKQNKIILGSLLILLSMALFFSFVSFYFTWQEDQSLLSEFSDRNEEAKNLLNKFGASVSHFVVYKGFGIASLIFTVLLCITGLYYFLSLEKKGLFKKWIWGLIFMIWISIALGFLADSQPLLGGLVGYEMNDFLQDYLGLTGAILLLSFFAIAYAVLRWGLTPEVMGSFVKKQKKGLSSEFKMDDDSDDESIPMEDTAFEKDNIEIVQPVEEVTMETSNTAKANTSSSKHTVNDQYKQEDPDDMAIEIEETVEEEEVEENLSSKLVQDFGEFDPRLELSSYKFPSIELLKDYTQGQSITIDQQE
ncbi:hypothetical protein LCGC14_2352320, partial [marine sediment metagenome]